MTNSEKIVQRQLDCYNNHDLSGFVSIFREDIEVYNLVDNKLMLKGRTEFEQNYRERFEVNKVNAVLENRIVIGNKVIDHESVTGIEKDRIVKAVAIYEVEENLIKRVWFLFE